MEIWVCNDDGLKERRLTRFGDVHANTPRWSPDGQSIAFTAQRDCNDDVFWISREGGPEHPLITDPGNDYLPSWSGDGKWIYFCSARNGTSAIWKLRADGSGQPVRITRSEGAFPLEGPDGFVYYLNPKGEIWKVPIDGGQESLVDDKLRGISAGRFAVMPSGIYYIDAGGMVPFQWVDVEKHPIWLKFFDFKTKEVRDIARLKVVPGSCLSVSPEEDWAVFTQCTRRAGDLMVLENFR